MRTCTHCTPSPGYAYMPASMWAILPLIDTIVVAYVHFFYSLNICFNVASVPVILEYSYDIRFDGVLG